MMQQEFKTRSHVGSDGILHLNVVTGLADADVTVKIVIEAETSASEPTLKERAAKFLAWATQPHPDLPLLSDEAISREGMYENERL